MQAGELESTIWQALQHESPLVVVSVLIELQDLTVKADCERFIKVILIFFAALALVEVNELDLTFVLTRVLQQYAHIELTIFCAFTFGAENLTHVPTELHVLCELQGLHVIQ